MIRDCTYLLGGQVELDVKYSESPKIPATLEDPAEGGEIEIMEVTVDGIEFDTECIGLQDSHGGYITLDEAIMDAIQEGKV